MAERTNQQWLADLRGPGRESALTDLRALLLRGLRYALVDRYGVSEAHLEDFVQEALLKILDGLDTFRGESRFTTWANKIAVRVAFSELRRKRWEDVSLQDLLAPYAGDFTPAFLTDPGPSPEKRATQEALLALVRRTIDEDLSARQRQALLAVMAGGMSLEEVARRMDTNRNALYKLIHDARRRLQRALLAQGLSPQEILAAFE
jgi:RNA polymerase sigma-70 factor, ECF subfamily